MTSLEDSARVKSVGVRTHIAPHASEIPELAKKMLVEYNASSHEHIVRRIARLTPCFRVRPPVYRRVTAEFRPGNQYYLLIREGYVPINIKFIDRARYCDAFKEFQQTIKLAVMEEIVGRALTNSQSQTIGIFWNTKNRNAFPNLPNRVVFPIQTLLIKQSVRPLKHLSKRAIGRSWNIKM